MIIIISSSSFFNSDQEVQIIRSDSVVLVTKATVFPFFSFLSSRHLSHLLRQEMFVDLLSKEAYEKTKKRFFFFSFSDLFSSLSFLSFSFSSSGRKTLQYDDVGKISFLFLIFIYFIYFIYFSFLFSLCCGLSFRHVVFGGYHCAENERIRGEEVVKAEGRKGREEGKGGRR